MSLPPRNFEEWMKQVNRTLTEVKRNSQASVSDQIGREVGKIEDQIKDIGDPRTPAAPVEVVVTSSVLPDSSKVNRGYITMTFPAVDVATDASPLDVASYEMYGRRVDNWDGQGDGPTFSLMASAFQPALTSDMVVPGSTYEVRARAIGETTTRPGLLSEVKSIVVIRDLIPPPIPSPLALSQNLSVVKGAWDGLDATGAPMPPDFAYTEPRIQLPSGYVSIEDYLTQAGNFLDTTAPYDIEVNYSHRAVDTSGNKSGWSIGMPITVKSLVDEGAIRDALDAAKEAIDAVSAELVTVGAELTTRLETAEADLLASNERLTANEGAIGTLTNTTIPALNTQITNAKNDITAAFGQISTVSGTATAALNAATHTGKNLFSTSMASGSAPYGSIWTQTDSNGKALASWQQTGGSAPHPTTGLGGVDGSTWTARPIRSEMIDNLDVGKLVTNTAEINNAVIGKMAVGIATVIELNAERITAGTINTARLNVQQIAAGTAAFQTVDVKNIFAGTGTFQTAVVDKLWADVISARTINAEQINIGPGENILPWGVAKKAPFDDWEGYASYGRPSAQVPANRELASGVSKGNSLIQLADWVTSGTDTITWRITPTKYPGSNAGAGFPVEPGREYLATAFLKAGGTYLSGMPKVRLSIYYYDESGAGLANGRGVPTTLTWNWDKYEVRAVAPATAARAIVYVFQDQPGVIRMDLPAMYMMKDASLIVDNGIIARNISASEEMTAKIATFLKINAGMILANAITSDKILAGAITSVKIDAEAVTADKIKVNSITATQIATNAITADELAANSVLAVNITANAITTDKILANAITTAKIATNAVTANEILANSITTAKIAAGAVTAIEIAANSVNADKMVIGTGLNIIPNNQLTSIAGWPGWGRRGSNGPGGNPSIWMLGRKNGLSDPFPVEGGKRYKFSVDVMGQKAGSRFYVQLNTDGSNPNPYMLSDKILTTGWKTFSDEFDMPPGATTGTLNVYVNHPNGTSTDGYQWYTNWSLCTMTDGTLIVSNSITAAHIKANSITASSIAANAITASELATNAVLAVNIATGALDAKLITGPTIRTQDSPSTKGGYQLDSYGFRIWSNTGVRTVDMNGTTGAVKIIGSLTSGKVGTASVVIDDSLWDLGFAGIHIEAYNNKVAGIKMATTGTYVGSLYLTSANNSTADIGTAKTRSQIRLQPTEFDMQATNSAGAVTSWVNGDATLLSLKSFAGKVDLHGVKGVTISAASGSDVDINAHGTASWYLSLRKDATSEFILSNAIYARRYTGSYPVVITGNGVLGCNVSSAKYKLAVQPIEEDYDDRLLSIRAVTWFDRTESEAVADFYDHMERGVPFIDENGNEVTETPTALRRIPGVIAEEVDAAGLKEFVNYENDGDVMGVMYDRFGVALIPVVRRQRDRIIELENDRDSMREALAALLSRVALLENAN